MPKDATSSEPHSESGRPDVSDPKRFKACHHTGSSAGIKEDEHLNEIAVFRHASLVATSSTLPLEVVEPVSTASSKLPDVATEVPKLSSTSLESKSARKRSSSIEEISVVDVRPVAKRAATAGSTRGVSKAVLLGRSNTTGQANRGTSSRRPTKGRAASTGTGLDQKKQLDYLELAKDMMSRLPEIVTKSQMLRGLTFFFITTEAGGKPATSQTALRLELVSRTRSNSHFACIDYVDQVAKHCGKVQPTFDPTTATHIICTSFRPCVNLVLL